MKRKRDETEICTRTGKNVQTDLRFAVEEEIPENLRECTFIHLKGFARGLRFSEKNEKLIELRVAFLSYMFDLLKKTNPSCLCWDGDN